MGNENDHYEGALLREIDRKVDIILESVSTLATSGQLVAIDERLTRVESDVSIIKKVVTAQSRDLRNHNRRLQKLEHAT